MLSLLLQDYHQHERLGRRPLNYCLKQSASHTCSNLDGSTLTFITLTWSYTVQVRYVTWSLFVENWTSYLVVRLTYPRGPVSASFGWKIGHTEE